MLYGDGEQTRDFTFVGDVVAATIAAANRGEPGHVYNIGGGARMSVNRVLELMTACTGTRPRIEHHPAQKGDVRDTYADTSAARRALGFLPTVALDAGIEAEYKWISNTVAIA
jgi:UDP-glucose 4-epimerase